MLTRWFGDEITTQTREAVANALNSTAQDAVNVAAMRAPRATGFMAGTIQVIDKASATKLEVTWGNITANYTLWQEIGSRGRPGRYFLRAGADASYPHLAERLAKI